MRILDDVTVRAAGPAAVALRELVHLHTVGDSHYADDGTTWCISQFFKLRHRQSKFSTCVTEAVSERFLYPNERDPYPKD